VSKRNPPKFIYRRNSSGRTKLSAMSLELSPLVGFSAFWLRGGEQPAFTVLVSFAPFQERGILAAQHVAQLLLQSPIISCLDPDAWSISQHASH